MALDMLEERQPLIEKLMNDTKCSAELFLGFSSGNGQGGAVFSAELLRRLAKLGLPLTFDLYPPDVDEQEIASGSAP